VWHENVEKPIAQTSDKPFGLGGDVSDYGTIARPNRDHFTSHKA